MTVDFNDYFWGEKNNGYEVLYQNMKYGLTATKDLADFFRERSNVEEHSSKSLSKLANKAGTGGGGTFSPLWIILKSTTERLSELHAQKVQKIAELVKNIIKYTEDLHKKHKTVKEEESSTQDAVHAMKESTTAVQKAKEVYNSKLQELEKIKKDNSPKDIEKAEAKLKKHQDDYKGLVEKHNIIKMEFEKKMTQTCKKFQEIEESHLKQMKEFLSSYIDIVQQNYDLVGQVHSDLKRQFLELTVDKLLEQFVLNKYTGLEKPENIELDLMNLSGNITQNNQSIMNASNSPTNSVALSNETVSGSSAQVINVQRKETNLRTWFASTTSSVLSASPPSNRTETPTLTNPNGQQIEEQMSPSSTNNQTSSTSQSTSKTSKIFHNLTHHQNKQQFTQQLKQEQEMKHQQKSSRRTTSLLNLFMSNSQVSGFLRSRREKAKSKKANKKKKDSIENTGAKDDKLSDGEEKDDHTKSEESSNLQSISATSASNMAPTAAPEDVDEDGYSIQPRDTPTWDKHKHTSSTDKNNFYSSSDSDSEDERERKIHVKINPINGSSAPMSASVDELRSTVENLSLSPIGILSSGRRGSNSELNSILNMKRSQSVSQQPFGDKPSNDLLGFTIFQYNISSPASQQHHNMTELPNATSPNASNPSTPITAHPNQEYDNMQAVGQYAPLQTSSSLKSPTLSVSRYADLGDIFSEVGDISISAPPSANLSKLTQRQIPTPTSTTGSIAIPRPPSRRSETAVRGRISPASMARADSVGSLEFRSNVAVGGSRGPSPLTIGMSDTIPIAVAFHEIIHAYFKGADESRCQVKMLGDMMLSFPAGIVNVLANNPNPAKLAFRVKNLQNLENILPNKQLITIDKLQSTSFSTMLEFNMPVLTSILRRQFEQNPNAPYFNVDILKYQVKSKPGASSCPFQLVSYWKCEQSHTDIKIDYKYNSHAMAQPSSLLNVSITIPVDGGVKNVQSKPHSAWLGESNRLIWNFTDISQHSDNAGVDTLRARLEVASGPSNPAILSTQFNCEGTTLSGIEFELAGSGYRLSLVKRRFVSGKYICEGDGIRSVKTPTPPVQSLTMSPNAFSKNS